MIRGIRPSDLDAGNAARRIKLEIRDRSSRHTCGTRSHNDVIACMRCLHWVVVRYTSPMKFQELDTNALNAISDDSTTTKNVARALSIAVRGGAAWFVCTCLLARLGGKYRRAGLEGMTAWAVAETVAAGIKAATDRPRPPGNEDSESSSMPSAHTAAAVAYAIAAAARAPIVGVPLGALASAVSWSRLSTRRHFPTDVAAGAVLGLATGTAVAVVSRRAKSFPLAAAALEVARRFP